MQPTNNRTLDKQYWDLIVAFLPAGILEYFDLTNIKKEPAGFYIYLEEKNQLPEESKGQSYHSKGFYPEVQIEDFPIRTTKVFLCIKRRRWEDPSSGQTITRDWHLIQTGTRMTKEFAAFLKEFNRILSR